MAKPPELVGHTSENLATSVGILQVVKCAWSTGCGWEVLQVGEGRAIER